MNRNVDFRLTAEMFTEQYRCYLSSTVKPLWERTDVDSLLPCRRRSLGCCLVFDLNWRILQSNSQNQHTPITRHAVYLPTKVLPSPRLVQPTSNQMCRGALWPVTPERRGVVCPGVTRKSSMGGTGTVWHGAVAPGHHQDDGHQQLRCSTHSPVNWNPDGDMAVYCHRILLIDYHHERHLLRQRCPL